MKKINRVILLCCVCAKSKLVEMYSPDGVKKKYGYITNGEGLWFCSEKCKERYDKIMMLEELTK